MTGDAGISISLLNKVCHLFIGTGKYISFHIFVLLVYLLPNDISFRKKIQVIQEQKALG